MSIADAMWSVESKIQSVDIYCDNDSSVSTVRQLDQKMQKVVKVVKKQT